MKTKTIKTADKKTIREQIMQSAVASFRIEGIEISDEMAKATLKKIEISLGK